MSKQHGKSYKDGYEHFEKEKSLCAKDKKIN